MNIEDIPDKLVVESPAAMMNYLCNWIQLEVPVMVERLSADRYSIRIYDDTFCNVVKLVLCYVHHPRSKKVVTQHVVRMPTVEEALLHAQRLLGEGQEVTIHPSLIGDTYHIVYRDVTTENTGGNKK